MLSQSTRLPKKRTRALVQLGHVRAPVSEHHDLAEVALARRAPPVGEQSLFRLHRVIGDEQATLASGVSEVFLCVTGAQPGQRVALGRLVLAAVLGEAHRAELITEGRVEPTRADGGELSRVPDQDRLAAGLLHEAKDRSEHPRLGHPCLVDHQHAPARQATRATGLAQQGVEGSRRDLGCLAKLIRGPSTRRRSDHRDPRAFKRVAERTQRGRLARPGDPDHADDPIGGEPRRGDERALLLGESNGSIGERRHHVRDAGARSTRLATPQSELERLALDRAGSAW